MDHNEIISHLRSQGHRLTPQRRLTLEALQHHADHHLSADEVAQAISARYPGFSVDLATIYRTLRWLSEAGLVIETSLGQNRTVYALLSQHHHHHLVCERCRVTIEADPTIFDTVRLVLIERYGFVPRFEHLAVFGTCDACRTEQLQEHAV